MPGYDDILSTFRDVGELELEQWRARFPGHRPLAFMNAYVPQELFHAAGFAPVLLLPGRRGYGRAQLHLPGFSCWVVRGALERALAGELSGWAGVAFAHTCDALQALSDLWPRAVPAMPSFHMAMPDHLATPAARPFLLAELQRLRRRLQGMTGRAVDDDGLRRSIALSNRTRALVQGLYGVAAQMPASSLHAALQAAFLMPAEVYNPLLAAFLEAFSPAEPSDGLGVGESSTSADPNAIRLVVVGPELADPTLYEVIADAGGRVVGDLLDLGERHFAGAVAETGDPLAALADHALALLPTPTKFHPQRRRDAALLEMVDSRRAAGVIFARQKFCEPHGFDLVSLKRALNGVGVPHLLVELEQTPNVGQMRTRVEAFLEMMS
jgi:benzoyl-CoA reductase/2-hydroxyglutaryl-CoA dehydratase subunit BcrC/BadD/HgdB